MDKTDGSRSRDRSVPRLMGTPHPGATARNSRRVGRRRHTGKPRGCCWEGGGVQCGRRPWRVTCDTVQYADGGRGDAPALRAGARASAWGPGRLGVSPLDGRLTAAPPYGVVWLLDPRHPPRSPLPSAAPFPHASTCLRLRAAPRWPASRWPGATCTAQSR